MRRSSRHRERVDVPFAGATSALAREVGVRRQLGDLKARRRLASRGRLAQLVRAAGLQPAGRGFESLSAHAAAEIRAHVGRRAHDGCLGFSSSGTRPRMAVWRSRTIGLRGREEAHAQGAIEVRRGRQRDGDRMRQRARGRRDRRGDAYRVTCRPQGGDLVASALRSRDGTLQVQSAIAGLSVPAQTSPGSLLPAVHISSTTMHLHKVSLAASRVAATTARVNISGTFAVASMPTHSNVFPLVIACTGGTTFGIECGSSTHPSYEAFGTFAKGTHASGTYSFGSLPTSATGWQLGIVLVDGLSNGGYTPAGSPVLVANGGSTAKVVRAVSMAFVRPELTARFSITSAPKGFGFLVEAVACPSTVTRSQLSLYLSFGNCAAAEALNARSLGLYVGLGTWTIREFYEPYARGVEQIVARGVASSRFEVLGATVSVVHVTDVVDVATSAAYLAPSVVGVVTSNLPAHTPYAALFFVDPTKTRSDAGGYVDPRPGATTKFRAYLDPGSWVAVSEAVPKTPYPPFADAAYLQVILHQLGPVASYSASHATRNVSYSVPTFTASIAGTLSIPQLFDAKNVSGQINAVPFTYVLVCPGPHRSASSARTRSRSARACCWAGSSRSTA